MKCWKRYKEAIGKLPELKTLFLIVTRIEHSLTKKKEMLTHQANRTSQVNVKLH